MAKGKMPSFMMAKFKKADEKAGAKGAAKTGAKGMKAVNGGMMIKTHDMPRNPANPTPVRNAMGARPVGGRKGQGLSQPVAGGVRNETFGNAFRRGGAVKRKS